MKRSKYHSFEELPLMLNVQDVADVLASAWPMPMRWHTGQDFPAITLGSRIIVPRDRFMAWIEEQAEKKFQ